MTIALVGDLGAGKTTFIQGFAQGLGIDQRIISPTFILMRKYDVKIPGKLQNFYHVDLYRIEENVHEEVTNLGLQDVWKVAGNVVAIEWAEKVKVLVPTDTIWINFESLGENRRKITVS